MDVTLVIPVFNDWDSARELLHEIDRVVSREHNLHLVLIDDGSTQARPNDLLGPGLEVFISVAFLRLKCNLGHQRALATALTWVGSSDNNRPVVVMDGDGEDKPSDIPRMLRLFSEMGGTTAVFAERTKRSESLVFKQFYRLYRWMHWIMIGLSVKIGNFSVIPPSYVEGLIVSNYLWYHYAATVVRARLPFVTVKTSRGHRYRGVSKMNFVSLVRHGISAIAVHAEVLSVRLLIASFIVTLLGMATLVVLVWIRFFSDLAIPGWATTASGLIMVLLLQILSLAFTFAMQSVSIHSNASFLPIRDCPILLSSVEKVCLADLTWSANAQ